MDTRCKARRKHGFVRSCPVSTLNLNQGTRQNQVAKFMYQEIPGNDK